MTTDSALADVALNTLLIGVSQFFRDPTVFETLRTIVIPALAGLARPLRIASIGCSAGAELYSVAMLLAEAGELDRSSLLGLDCRPTAINLARTGVFAEAALGSLDFDLHTRYFESATDGWRVVEAIRRRTEWRVLDATRECPPGPWDVVLCRNLVIHLQTRAVDMLFERLSRQLAPGGRARAVRRRLRRSGNLRSHGGRPSASRRGDGLVSSGRRQFDRTRCIRHPGPR